MVIVISTFITAYYKHVACITVTSVKESALVAQLVVTYNNRNAFIYISV